jgi:uncharacterized protein GlcG (DUF336 family)
MKHTRLRRLMQTRGMARLVAALAGLGNVALLSVCADGETPAGAPRLSIPQLLPDGCVRVAAPGGAGWTTRLIEASTDLVHWTPISSNRVPSSACPNCPPIDFEDAETATLARRFYRAVMAPVAPRLNSNDVAAVMAQALTRANFFLTNGTATNGVVAVVDREGFVLGVWSLGSGANQLDVIDAITKAGTAAFLSSDQHAFSSRTAGFIVQQNFPPGIQNRPAGPLVGVNFSNLSFSDVNRFKDPQTYSTNAFGGGTNGAPISGPALAALSGLAGSPGGLPLYKTGRLVGGVGAVVTGQTPIPELNDIQLGATQRPDVDEDVALAGQFGFEPANTIAGSTVFIDGLRLPYVNSQTERGAVAALGSLGSIVPPYGITNSPPVSYPAASLGGIAGEIRAPIIDDPITNLIDGVARLTASEVTDILTLAAQRAAITRAGIRLPAGQPAQVFISVVNNPDNSSTPPAVLGTFRTSDATIFSWDVSVQKARTALFFSSPLAAAALPPELTGKALSTRTVGFLSQSLYPPGISGTAPGPLLGLQEQFSLIPVNVTNPLNGVNFTAANPPPSAPDPNLPNGITIFPGGFPLYRDGKLIGAIGVSGDGVDQDDLIAASGTIHFLPPNGIRADQIIFRGARLPYAKFPRNPSL